MIRRSFVALLVVVAFLYPARAGATSWAFDFVRFHGITYADRQNGVGRPLTRADLGPVFDTVRFRILGTPCEYNPVASECQGTEGVALSLPVGTPVYAVKGYQPAFRLAAYRNGALVLFEAVTNPAARRGGQLLDIAGKARSIAIQSSADPRTVLATIRNRREVTRLTMLIVRAPVNPRPPSGDHYLVLNFHLRDGTATEQFYSRVSGVLGDGITLPKAFGAAITRALRTRAVSVSIVSADVERWIQRTDQEFVSPPYPTREAQVRELTHLVAAVRYPGSPQGTPVNMSWAIFRDGQDVFRYARTEKVGTDHATRTFRYSAPFAPTAPGHYRFRLRVAVHGSARTWSGDFSVITGLGPIGMTFRLPDNLDVTPTRASFERCLPGIQGAPPRVLGKTGKVFLLTRWSLSNVGRAAARVPDFHLIMPDGTTKAGSYAGYPAYMNPLAPKQSETLLWAWEASRSNWASRLTYGNAPTDGQQGGAWFVKALPTPSTRYCRSS